MVCFGTSYLQFFPDLFIHLYFFSYHEVYFSQVFQNTKAKGMLITGVSMNNSKDSKEKEKKLRLKRKRDGDFVLYTWTTSSLDTFFSNPDEKIYGNPFGDPRLIP